MGDKIYLNESIPMLFGVPSAKGSNRAILGSLLVVVLSIIGYLLVDLWDTFPFFYFSSALLLAHLVLALKTTGANIIYLFRYMLVWILIFAAASVYAWYRGEVLLNWFGPQYQTIENTRTLVLAGIFSLCGSLTGLHISLRKFRRFKLQLFAMESVKRRRMWYLGMLLASGFALLYLWKAGGFIGGVKAYGNVDEGFELTFGVMNIFHFMGIALLLLSGVTVKGIQRKSIYLAVLSLIPGMMTGSRADLLPQAFLISMLIANSRVAYILEKNTGLFFAFSLAGTLLASIAYIIASAIAIWRTGGVDIWEVKQTLLFSDRGRIIQEIEGVKVIFLETGNMMLGGLYSAIVQVREGYTVW